MNNFPLHFESIGQLDADQIDRLLFLAKEFKDKDEAGLLPSPIYIKKFISAIFLENSSRTIVSFEMAARKMGAQFIHFNASSSSLKKGESLEEALMTLYHQGIHATIIRHSESKWISKLDPRVQMKIINGGDGTNEHPTQALLDLFTISELGHASKGKKITIVGDILHSRVSNSLYKLLTLKGLEVNICSPKELLPKSGFEKAKAFNSIDQAIESSDMLYMLRVQNERHSESSFDKNAYIKQFGLTKPKLNKEIPIFHPGPVNIGVELDLDIIKSQNYKGYEQVKNSIYMRMAIIDAILNRRNDEENASL